MLTVRDNVYVFALYFFKSQHKQTKLQTEFKVLQKMKDFQLVPQSREKYAVNKTMRHWLNQYMFLFLLVFVIPFPTQCHCWAQEAIWWKRLFQSRCQMQGRCLLSHWPQSPGPEAHKQIKHVLLSLHASGQNKIVLMSDYIDRSALITVTISWKQLCFPQ